MSEISQSKFDSVFKLLAEYDFCTGGNVPEKFKCKNCKGILINACQVQCGCRFCHACIDELLSKGCQTCPGDTDYCRNECLSDFQKDYSRNTKVAQMIVKCPEITCNYECTIIDMADHMKYCPESSKKLSHDFSHVNETLASEIEVDPNQLVSQNKILKEEIERNRVEIDILKQMLTVKDENFELIKEEIKIIKANSAKIDHRVDLLNRDLTGKFHEICLEICRKFKNEIIILMNDEIRASKIENNGLLVNVEKQLEIITKDMFNKTEINEKLDEIQKGFGEILEKTVRKINKENKKYQSDMTVKMNQEIQYFHKILDGVMFVWNIADVSEMRKIVGKDIWSEYFFCRMNKRKFRLQLYNVDNGTELLIILCIYSNSSDNDLSWPFQGNMTIKIANKANHAVGRSITKHCSIDKPSNNSYNCSDTFSFLYSDLFSSGTLQDNCFIIEYSMDQSVYFSNHAC